MTNRSVEKAQHHLSSENCKLNREIHSHPPIRQRKPDKAGQGEEGSHRSLRCDCRGWKTVPSAGKTMLNRYLLLLRGSEPKTVSTRMSGVAIFVIATLGIPGARQQGSGRDTAVSRTLEATATRRSGHAHGEFG